MIFLSFLISAWAGTALGFTITALINTRRLHARARQATARVTAWPKIALVRPCEGLDPALADTLRSSLRARYDGPRAIFFCVPSAHDPAHAVAVAVRDELIAAGGDVRLIVTELGDVANRKAAQLAVVERQLPDDAGILVVADSDVLLHDDSLPSLVGALVADPEAGASSAPPIDVAPRTLGDRASAALLSSTPHALLALAALSEWAGRGAAARGRAARHSAHGARRCRRLRRARALPRRRLRAGAPPPRGRSAHGDVGRRRRVSPTRAARFCDVIRRYARWSLVMRRQRPSLFATYVLLLGCAPLVTLATLVLAALHAPLMTMTLTMASSLLLARALLAGSLRRCYGVGGSLAARAGRLAPRRVADRGRGALGVGVGRGRVARPSLLRRGAWRARARRGLNIVSRRLRQLALPLGGIAGLIALWSLAVALGHARILPGPWKVALGIVDLARRGLLLKYVVASLFRVTWGYLSAVARRRSRSGSRSAGGGAPSWR